MFEHKEHFLRNSKCRFFCVFLLQYLYKKLNILNKKFLYCSFIFFISQNRFLKNSIFLFFLATALEAGMKAQKTFFQKDFEFVRQEKILRKREAFAQMVKIQKNFCLNIAKHFLFLGTGTKQKVQKNGNSREKMKPRKRNRKNLEIFFEKKFGICFCLLFPELDAEKNWKKKASKIFRETPILFIFSLKQ